ncbi:hypothetical protein [Paraclostridium bifermentans]|uniref:hypothetical protein n=1 Tax=Paraclostridium bifermentans TaxID=1490 RepID=UPI001158E04B|nr:hypothetical protein [Paraclostridium bifermentans]TQO55614.1 hypothetical protein D5S05_17525 [Paraclostridium bifermentans]
MNNTIKELAEKFNEEMLKYNEWLKKTDDDLKEKSTFVYKNYHIERDIPKRDTTNELNTENK